MSNKEFVKSFEVAGDGEIGDIVSKNRKKARGKLKVGLLSLSWFEWWPMFPESGMKEQIQADGDRFIDIMRTKFGDTYELVVPEGHIDTLNKAYDAGEFFRKQGIDAIVMEEATYVTDFIPMQALESIPDIPLILFVTQASDDLWPTMNNKDIIRYEGLVGATQIAGAFAKTGRKYQTVVGSLEDEEAFDTIGAHLQIINLIRDLKYIDIGLVGHTFRGMYDIEVDKTKIKGALGLNVLYIDVSHLLEIWKSLSQDEVAAFRDEMLAKLPNRIEETTIEDITKSAALGLATTKLIDHFGIETLSMLGQHHVEAGTLTSADFSFYCAELKGCVTSHEGDIGNLAMKYVLKRLSGEMPVFLEWSAFDISSDTMLLTHHGVIDPNVYACELSKCRITPSPEKWDFTGKGMSVEFCAKAGQVTLACLLDGKDGWKMLVSRGECIEMPQTPSFAPQFHFRHEKLHVKEYIRQIVQEGVAHHVCLVYGDYVERLELFSEYTGIPVVEV